VDNQVEYFKLTPDKKWVFSVSYFHKS
jgi:hypothetical protein